MTPEELLASLGIRTSSAPVEASRSLSAHLDAMAALNLSPSHEEFIDGLFASEEVAVEVLSSNPERLIVSMKQAASFLAAFGESNSLVFDFGGGPGLVSFWSAQKFPRAKFCVVERSAKCIQIGTQWKARLSLSNVDFHRDAESMNLSNLGKFNLVLVEYVFSLLPASDEDEVELRNLVETALRTLRPILASDATCQIRFGGYCPTGLAILLEEMDRGGFKLDLDNCNSGHWGTTLTVCPTELSTGFGMIEDRVMELMEVLSLG
jgi:hypothetical protein